MSIPESVIEAAGRKRYWEDGSARARRTLLALAENMPKDAVTNAIDEFWNVLTRGPDEAAMRGALCKFLKHVAGEK